ncbi:hypothetical protein [Streptomyces sp. NPDC059786]|uniref:hypothetical protein n=1 Tax=Streptomyces sp. NPDC059786 TaxID=3346946 RepID=UPI00365A2F11
MPPKRRQTRRTAPAKRRKPAARTSARKHPARRVKLPRGGKLHHQLAMRMVMVAASHYDTHQDTVRARRDMAIIKLSHQGCKKCGGKGQLHTKGKNGEFTGSKPCPAKPTKQKISKWAAYKASRFGADKNTGLMGCTCPCGWTQKPRYRDAKTATRALRAHEKQKHGGVSVGGAWTVQDGASTQTAQTTQSAAASAPVTKTNTGRAMSNTQWLKQNKPPSAAKAKRDGLCRHCTSGALYSISGGQQTTAVCPFCNGTGKDGAATSSRSQSKPAKGKSMPDYSNPNTRLTGGQYAYSAVLKDNSQQGGGRSHNVKGVYPAQPDYTVLVFCSDIRSQYAVQHNVPIQDVILERYSLREK